MKLNIVILTIASVFAQTQQAYGDDCTEATVCEDPTLACVEGLCDDNASACNYCQDCSTDMRMWDDGYFFMCPGEEEEGSNYLGASIAAATLAISAIMA